MSINIQTYKSKGLLQGDATIWTVLIFLCIISIIEVYSASSNMTYQTGKYWQPVVEHSIFVFIGLAITWLLHQIPCKLYKIFSLFMVLLSFGMLIWALVAGTKTNDAGRWISILGKTVQPSEFAKLALIGYIAYIMSACRDEKNKVSMFGLKMIGIVSVIFIGLIGMENFSTAGILFCIVIVMLIIGEAPKKVLVTLLAAIFLAVAAIGTTMMTMSQKTANELGESYHALHRLPTWVHRLHTNNERPKDPSKYNVSDNQQVAHAKIAVATCNYVGRGPGKSIERDYLPQAFSDFIYAIIIEEGGIESATVVMLLYLLLLYRSWRIAKRCVNPFPAFLVMGLSAMLVLQALINMGVAVGLLPVTGQPLPLVSKGGTSYIITCMYIGMILSVSRSAKRNDMEEIPVPVNMVPTPNNEEEEEEDID